MKTQGEDSIERPGERPWQEPAQPTPGCPTSGLLRLWENLFLLWKPLSLRCFVLAAQQTNRCELLLFYLPFGTSHSVHIMWILKMPSSWQGAFMQCMEFGPPSILEGRGFLSPIFRGEDGTQDVKGLRMGGCDHFNASHFFGSLMNIVSKCIRWIK